jgi:hypothetical protein
MGILRLLARWAVEIGGLKGVSEEELLEEVWSVGAGEWEQAVEESEVDPPDGSGAARKDRFRVEPVPTKARPSGMPRERMPKPDVRFDQALLRRVDAFAGSEGITRSRAVRELCGMGLDLIESQKGITQGRIDELLECIESEKRLMAHLGTATVGILRLLAHWATQTGGLRVSEDEFVAEVRTAGHEEWERISREAACRLRGAGSGGEGRCTSFRSTTTATSGRILDASGTSPTARSSFARGGHDRSTGSASDTGRFEGMSARSS